MKRRITILLTLILMLTLAACGSPEPGAPEVPAAPAKAEAVSVRFRIADPGTEADWQILAAEYTAQTGAAVQVYTGAPEGLGAELAAEQPPTLFQCGSSPTGRNPWADQALTLEGTGVLEMMTTQDFNLKTETGETKAIAYRYEAAGLLVNKTLLTKAGHTLEEITGFAPLKTVADRIHSQHRALGFDAFCAPGLSRATSWSFSSHLSNMPLYYEFSQTGITCQPETIQGTYLENLRSLWNLYLQDTSANTKALLVRTAEEAAADFREGKAVFCQGGTWDYEELVESGMEPDQLALIPLYCDIPGEEACGLSCGTDSWWAVNASASQEEIQETLAFLKWVLTSEEAGAMLARQYPLTPFENVPASESGFYQELLRFQEGKGNVSWVFQSIPNPEFWSATVVTALGAYAADPRDAVWDQFTAAFVDGWAYEYRMQQD